MVAGADEAALLCAPECEAHATAGLRRPLGQSQRRFEHYSRAATIVVDARPLRHAVEMRTNDDEGAIAVKGRVGQHVSSQPLSDHGVDLEAHSGAAASCDIEGAAEFVRRRRCAMEAKLTAGLWAMAAAFALCASQAQARCVCNYMWRAPIINSGPPIMILRSKILDLRRGPN